MNKVDEHRHNYFFYISKFYVFTVNKGWKSWGILIRSCHPLGYIKCFSSYRRTDSFSEKTLPPLCPPRFFFFFWLCEVTPPSTAQVLHFLHTKNFLYMLWIWSLVIGHPQVPLSLPPFIGVSAGFSLAPFPELYTPFMLGGSNCSSAGEKANTTPTTSNLRSHFLPWPGGALQWLLLGISIAILTINILFNSGAVPWHIGHLLSLDIQKLGNDPDEYCYIGSFVDAGQSFSHHLMLLRPWPEDQVGGLSIKELVFISELGSIVIENLWDSSLSSYLAKSP